MAARKAKKKERRKMGGTLFVRLPPDYFGLPYPYLDYVTQKRNPRSGNRYGFISYHGKATRRSDKIVFGKFLRSHKLKLDRNGMIVHINGRQLTLEENKKFFDLGKRWEVKYPSKIQRIIEGKELQRKSRK